MLRFLFAYTLLQNQKRVYSSDFLGGRWLATRAEETLMMLIIHNAPEIIVDDGEAREDDVIQTVVKNTRNTIRNTASGG